MKSSCSTYVDFLKLWQKSENLKTEDSCKRFRTFVENNAVSSKLWENLPNVGGLLHNTWNSNYFHSSLVQLTDGERDVGITVTQ